MLGYSEIKLLNSRSKLTLIPYEISQNQPLRLIQITISLTVYTNNPQKSIVSNVRL